MLFRTSACKTESVRKDSENAHDARLERELYKKLKKTGFRYNRKMGLDRTMFDKEDKMLIPILIEYIDEFDDKFLKCHYLSCLGVKGFNDATEYLLKEYERCLPPTYDPEILGTVSQTIARIQDPTHIDTCLNLLNNDKIVFETKYIIRMLGEMRVEKALPRLMEILDDNIIDGFDSEVSEYQKHILLQEAIRALSQFENPEHIRYVEKFLDPKEITWTSFPSRKEKRVCNDYGHVTRKAIEKMNGRAHMTGDAVMYIKDILFYDGYDAEIVVTDGRYDLLCMCLSVPLPLGSAEPEKGMGVAEISAFATNGIYAKRIENDDGKKYIVEKGKGYFEYTLRGEIIDKEEPTIRVGDLIIGMNELSEDLRNGDIIEFRVGRLDCLLY